MSRQNGQQWESDEQVTLLDPTFIFLPDWGEERLRRRRPPTPPPGDEPSPDPIATECPTPAPTSVEDPVVEQARQEVTSVVIERARGLSGVPLALVVAGSMLAGGLAVAVLDRALAPAVPTQVAASTDLATKSDIAAFTALLQRREGTTPDTDAMKAELGSLKGLLERGRSADDAIAERLTRVEETIKGGRTNPAADLKLLREKVDGLEQGARKLEPIPGLVAGVKRDLDQNITKIDERLARLLDEGRKVAYRPPYLGTADPTEVFLKRGVALLGRRDFAGARDVFLGLTDVSPSDARAWYYAALANAFVTGVWDRGETATLFQKGIDCERRGLPDRAAIDEAFATLGRDGGRDWLAYYRSTATEAGPH